MHLHRFLAHCLIAIVLTALTTPCARAVGTNAAANPLQATETQSANRTNAFRILAYATEGMAADRVPYSQLTHINYSFLIPNAVGTFKPLGNAGNLKKIVEAAHGHHVRVCIAVGGWGWDSEFEQMASHADTRTAFVANLSQFVQDYGLDGADIDWEYPDPGQSSQDFLALIRELRAALPDKLLTAAVVSHGNTGLGIPVECFPLLDFVNIMTYDGPQHATMEHFNQGLSFWKSRGLPASKMVMGVPFYSRAKESPGETASYSQLVAADPAAAQADTARFGGLTHNYNGIPTIREKTRIARQDAGGIMFWVLNADATGDLSLLNAISQTVHAHAAETTSPH